MSSLCHTRHGEGAWSLCHHCVAESLVKVPTHCLITVSQSARRGNPVTVSQKVRTRLQCDRKENRVIVSSLCQKTRSLSQQTWGENRVMASSLCHRKHAGENQIIVSSLCQKKYRTRSQRHHCVTERMGRELGHCVIFASKKHGERTKPRHRKQYRTRFLLSCYLLILPTRRFHTD